MLNLRRKIKEAIIIGGERVRIVVNAIDGDEVILGFDAPRSVNIYREELYYKIAKEEKERSVL